MSTSPRARISLRSPSVAPVPHGRPVDSSGAGGALRPFAEYLRQVADDLEAGRPANVAALRSAVDDLEGALRAAQRAGTVGPVGGPERG
ncbi:hypothetical protein [Kitasatospora sp. NBC_01300]|uniref:hypothetical protein n=1 Tax=Kitasatospora sp. NBC_01300 TaxID=2903574 RepID=UPI002F9173B3|nr:hypothetical protein OG556_40985 [Kitasatospora sp. NBC_01300]